MCDDFRCLLPVGRTEDDDNGDGVTLTRMETFPVPVAEASLTHTHTKLRKDEGNYHKNNQERKSLFGANLFLSYFFSALAFVGGVGKIFMVEWMVEWWVAEFGTRDDRDFRGILAGKTTERHVDEFFCPWCEI